MRKRSAQPRGCGDPAAALKSRRCGEGGQTFSGQVENKVSALRSMADSEYADSPLPGASNFVIRGLNFFLTYPRCSLNIKDACECLQARLSAKLPIYILGAREQHADGSPHLHILIQLTNSLRTRDCTFFDLAEFHPNIQVAKSPRQVRAYIKKHPSDLWEHGTFRPSSGRPRGSFTTGETKDSRMREIIRCSTSRSEYLSMVRDAFPFDWATRLAQFQYSAAALFPEVPAPYVSPVPTEDLMCNELIGNWLNADLFTVSVDSYQLCVGEPSFDQARTNLQWMADYTSREVFQQGLEASTSAVQQEQERQPGQEA